MKRIQRMWISAVITRFMIAIKNLDVIRDSIAEARDYSNIL